MDSEGNGSFDREELLRRSKGSTVEGVVKEGWMAFCPGCQCGHLFDDRWAFNGSLEHPTFTPSMLVNQDDPATRCHSYVKNGRWEFLQDSAHALAGKTVDMVKF